MGKGDIRSRRGKIWRGTTGVTRPRKRKRTALRPVAPVRKVKALKDLPKIAEDTIVKKTVVETVNPLREESLNQAAETSVIETVQPVTEVIAAEAPQIEADPVTETVVAETETKSKTKKAPALKKPAAKKAPAVKKPAAKKTTAKKKK